MTVKELKKFLEMILDDYQVCLERDVPGKVIDKPADWVYESEPRNSIILGTNE